MVGLLNSLLLWRQMCVRHLLMNVTPVVQISARVGWIIEVSQQDDGYRCWVINRELDVLSDGYIYATSSAALAAGRLFVERS